MRRTAALKRVTDALVKGRVGSRVLSLRDCHVARCASYCRRWRSKPGTAAT